MIVGGAALHSVYHDNHAICILIWAQLDCSLAAQEEVRRARKAYFEASRVSPSLRHSVDRGCKDHHSLPILLS